MKEGLYINETVKKGRIMGFKALRIAILALGLLPQVAAAETITASFLKPDGGVTTGLFSGIVHVTVSGIGQSLGTQFNDAFYLFDPPVQNASYYQLTFGTSKLVGYAPAQDAKNFLVGGLPSYNASHVYSFDLDTGTFVPTQLHFGVSDGIFCDNSGEYNITVTAAVPEPSTWAMMILGFVGLGMVAYRRDRRAAPAHN